MHRVVASLYLVGAAVAVGIPLAGAQALTPLTDDNINAAAKMWIDDENQARTTYGEISEWNMSQVSTLDQTFYNAHHS